MFIRRTKTSASAKRVHYSYRLVQTCRVADKVKQKTLINLGAHFDLDRVHWPDLCVCVETQLSDQAPLLPVDYPAEILTWAQRIVQRLRPAALEGEAPWVETVDLHAQKDEGVRTVGLERLGLHSLTQLGLPGYLCQLGLKPSYQKLGLALIVAKMARPDSELGTYEWLTEVSALPELLQITDAELKLERLYRVGDALYRHQTELEAWLSAQTRESLGGDATVLLYDLTNTWFTTSKSGSRLAQFGRGKQRGKSAPVVTLGLSMDALGFPRHSELLPGNISEPGTLEEAIGRLQIQSGETVKIESLSEDIVERVSMSRPLVIMDAGICTEANCQWLQGQGYDYVTISRSKRTIPDREADADLTTTQGGKVSAWRVESTDEAVYLVVHSEDKSRKEAQILLRQRQQLEAELTYLHEGLCRPRRLKKVVKVREKIGRLKQKYRRVQTHYEIDMEVGEKADRVTAIRWTKTARYTEAEQRIGSYVLRSSRTTLDEEALVRLSAIPAPQKK